MTRLFATLAALLLTSSIARAQAPTATPPADAPAATKPADSAPATAPAATPPADAPPAAAAPAAPPAAAKDAPVSAEAAPAGDAPKCSTEEVDKHIDAALAALAASPAYKHAGGHFKRAEIQLHAAKKSAAGGCKVFNAPKKGKPAKAHKAAAK